MYTHESRVVFYRLGREVSVKEDSGCHKVPAICDVDTQDDKVKWLKITQTIQEYILLCFMYLFLTPLSHY
jgi:hypothetical protein